MVEPITNVHPDAVANLHSNSAFVVLEQVVGFFQVGEYQEFGKNHISYHMDSS